jgi:hypothetical protein
MQCPGFSSGVSPAKLDAYLSVINISIPSPKSRELGISTLKLSRKLGISQPTASQSAKRGERIVKEKRLKLMG